MANLVFVILVASVALSLPSTTTASAAVDPSKRSLFLPPPPPVHQKPLLRPVKVSHKRKPASARENGDDVSETPISSKDPVGRKPWPKKFVDKSPPPPF